MWDEPRTYVISVWRCMYSWNEVDVQTWSLYHVSMESLDQVYVKMYVMSLWSLFVIPEWSRCGDVISISSFDGSEDVCLYVIPEWSLYKDWWHFYIKCIWRLMQSLYEVYVESVYEVYVETWSLYEVSMESLDQVYVSTYVISIWKVYMNADSWDLSMKSVSISTLM